jgi:tRNA1Val (adenine37-N6)-methyltransferase
MSNSYFQFKQFTIHQDQCAMKVTTDACLFGAWVADKIKSEKPEAKRILDIGTGTGLLTLMLHQKNSDTKTDAIEIDEEAYQQACENVNASPWKENIKVIPADVKSYAFTYPYDVIISNPPFYEKELKGNNKKKNLAHHNEGLLLPELLSVIKNHLQPNGIFYLLLPYKRNEEVKQLITDSQLSITHLGFVKQSTQHHYFRLMLAGKIQPHEEQETIIDEIAIKDDSDGYTPEFINLLKEYYLYL